MQYTLGSVSKYTCEVSNLWFRGLQSCRKWRYYSSTQLAEQNIYTLEFLRSQMLKK